MDWQDARQKFAVILRLIQTCVAVASLVLLVAYKACGELILDCIPTNNDTHNEEICIKFPFQLAAISVTDYCSDNTTDLLNTTTARFGYVFHDDYSYPTKFFALVALVSAAVSMLVIILYMTIWKKYHETIHFPIADLVATVAMSAYWLAAAISMSGALSGIGDATESQTMLNNTVDSLQSCYAGTGHCSIQQGDIGNYFTIHVVVLIGFLSVLFWFGQTILIFRTLRFVLLKEKEKLVSDTMSDVNHKLQNELMPETTKIDSDHVSNGCANGVQLRNTAGRNGKTQRVQSRVHSIIIQGD